MQIISGLDTTTIRREIHDQYASYYKRRLRRG